jgi:hypothetical protein
MRVASFLVAMSVHCSVCPPSTWAADDDPATAESEHEGVALIGVIGLSSFCARTPSELAFGCVGSISEPEESAAKLLMDVHQPAASRTHAASQLWNGKSRAYAPVVLSYLAKPLPGCGKEFRQLLATTESDLAPESIRKELLHGKYEWGAWLAFLRPAPEVVPLLIDHLELSTDYRDETILALGASGDQRALPVLLKCLSSGDYSDVGFAASALAYYGDPETEGPLINALRHSHGAWDAAKICRALGVVGTTRALPHLRDMANRPRGGGAVNANVAASDAIREIQQRHPSEQAPAPAPKESEPSDGAESR